MALREGVKGVSPIGDSRADQADGSWVREALSVVWFDLVMAVAAVRPKMLVVRSPHMLRQSVAPACRRTREPDVPGFGVLQSLRIVKRAALWGFLAAGCWAAAAERTVGPGKDFARIEDAYAAAAPGDVILVYPREGGEPYETTALLVKKPRLTFRGVTQVISASVGGNSQSLVRVSGKGFDYSGRGRTPRAVFQFDPEADGCVLEGFEIFGAHNDSHNGAGVRINQADSVVIRGCRIHGNDMGIMSNGDGSPAAGVDQRIEKCIIYGNGDPADPGYNHNLYLGGASVRLRFCEIYGSLTGHNVKSRAHHTWVECCYIHDSANRELDLVDAAETTIPESHAVLWGNIIAKNPRCSGNRGVIHFGQDGGKGRNGTLFLYFNTIVTPFISPVIELSTPEAKARMIGNLVSDGGSRQSGQSLIAMRGGAEPVGCLAVDNWFTGSFAVRWDSLASREDNSFAWAWPLFADSAGGDFRLIRRSVPPDLPAYPSDKIVIPAFLGEESQAEPAAWRYVHPASGEARSDRRQPIFGAQPIFE
ncbi:hypothetical protein JCM17478_03290 [Thermopirellula anaerolimosa]